MRNKKKYLLLVGAVLLGILLAGCVLWKSFSANVRDSLGQRAEGIHKEWYERQGMEPVGFPKTVEYQGETYQYRDDVISVLLLGIDGPDKLSQNIYCGFGWRMDFVILAVWDTRENTLCLLQICRDAMTPILIYDSLWQLVGAYEQQLCMQYAYGDGLEESCRLAAMSVSKLLKDIPIHGCVAAKWSAVAIANDAVGGVEVTVPKELTTIEELPFTEAGTYRLKGEQAAYFVQNRDTGILGSNLIRGERQKEFIVQFLKQFKGELLKNPKLLETLLEELKDYTVFEIDTKELCYLGIESLGAEISMEEIKGAYQEGLFHDEFVVDQEALTTQVLRLFYEKSSR